MSKVVFQRYTTPSGEQYEFELTDGGIIYLFDKSTKSRTQLNETERVAIERGLITIGDWEKDPLAFDKTVDDYCKELDKAKDKLNHPARVEQKRKPHAGVARAIQRKS